ncbi:NAD-dependent epimerase/dehydratase family protein [Rubrivirga sp.]|uniref:NAD-dependent epimerase/dehydratase family protein n=1 Tax=Rubrivirga sp. TaxID=1885344 RepID=UPI003B51D369
MPDLHVVFGTGPLGRSTVEALVERGRRVRWVSRSGQAADVPPGVDLRAADATDPAQARAAVEGAAVVYNCTNAPYTAEGFETELPRLFGGILDAAEAAGARLVVGDNLYAVDEGPQPIRESGPEAPTTRKGRARKAVGDAMLEAHRRGRLPVVVVRGSDFFGPYATDQSHLGSRAIPPLLAGKTATMIGGLDHPHSMTYVRDFGRALATLGEADGAHYGRAWHVPNAPAETRRAVLARIAREIGTPLKVRQLGPVARRVFGLFIPPLREMEEMTYQLDRPYVIDASDFAATFDVEATPLDQSVAETVDWFRTHPDA